MAKKWHLEVDTQPACCIIATHTNSKYKCTRRGVAGVDKEGVGSATPTHFAQDNSALSSVQAQTQANKTNNNSNNNDITAPNKMAGTGFA